MSYYTEGKQFFKMMADVHGHTEVLDEYELIKNQSGEFVGALFIKQVYMNYLDSKQERLLKQMKEGN
jgi:hypothetical protein